ncbi:hypothetical protein J2Y91_004453 [Erwinia aphidicola]|nr:hypothetical protein [Erwinia aphidicola]
MIKKQLSADYALLQTWIWSLRLPVVPPGRRLHFAWRSAIAALRGALPVSAPEDSKRYLNPAHAAAVPAARFHWPLRRPLRKAGKPASSGSPSTRCTCESLSLLMQTDSVLFPTARAAAELLSGRFFFSRAPNKSALHPCTRSFRCPGVCAMRGVPQPARGQERETPERSRKAKPGGFSDEQDGFLE